MASGLRSFQLSSALAAVLTRTGSNPRDPRNFARASANFGSFRTRRIFGRALIGKKSRRTPRVENHTLLDLGAEAAADVEAAPEVERDRGNQGHDQRLSDREQRDLQRLGRAQVEESQDRFAPDL